MATVEHCLYCFEALSAELENRPDPLSLTDVQKSYAAYLTALQSQQPTAAATTTTEPSSAKKIPALARLAAAANNNNSSSSSLAATEDSNNSSASSSTSLSTAATSLSPAPPPRERVADPDAEYPLFVTWDKLHAPSGEYHLRGCIGTFSASSPLSATLSEYALISALHDTRFSRVAPRELPQLRASVTLLTNFEDCAGVDDWVVGEHGIRISFRDAARRYGATYLPSVAPEQGWGKEETMASLMRKAGWTGKGLEGNWRAVAERCGMSVERYRGDKEEVGWEEFKQWRDWVGENWKGE